MTRFQRETCRHHYHCMGQVQGEIWTNKISGFSDRDCYFAAKADPAFDTLRKG